MADLFADLGSFDKSKDIHVPLNLFVEVIKSVVLLSSFNF